MLNLFDKFYFFNWFVNKKNCNLEKLLFKMPRLGINAHQVLRVCIVEFVVFVSVICGRAEFIANKAWVKKYQNLFYFIVKK